MYKRQIEKAFEEEHKDVDVELHLSSELDKDLQKDFKNGNVPDVVYYNLGQESGFVETMLKEKAIADISDAVSYTHLDVYKRQVSFR